MTPEEARIVVLEHALVEAVHAVEFLHGCLTQPSPEEMERVINAAGEFARRKDAEPDRPAAPFLYGHPEQTERHLADWRKLVHVPQLCHHSYYAPARGQPCEACEEREQDWKRLVEAHAVLDDQEPQG